MPEDFSRPSLESGTILGRERQKNYDEIVWQGITENCKVMFGEDEYTVVKITNKCRLILSRQVAYRKKPIVHRDIRPSQVTRVPDEEESDI